MIYEPPTSIRTIMFLPLGPPVPITLLEVEGLMLRSLYGAIGCTLVERVSLDDGVDLLVDEMGRINNAPYNRTWVVKRGGRISGYAEIFGRAVVLGLGMVKRPDRPHPEPDWIQPSHQQLVTACTLASYTGNPETGEVAEDAHRMRKMPTAAQLFAWVDRGESWIKPEEHNDRGRTIRDIIAVALEVLSRDQVADLVVKKRSPFRQHVLAYVHDYSRHRGIILNDSDITSELNTLLDRIRGEGR